MGPYATLDRTSPALGSQPAVKTEVELNLEKPLQQECTIRTAQPAIPAALAAVDPGARSALLSGLRFPGDDGGRSLAQMAESDLDAALQLLADRAQYITGANGAAIALRRDGRNDMQCRASTGSNVPELGALLSTEFGLSGESVRTRKALRCDDADRDPRVNREGCRQLGIASVVVMPVVNDDEVMGVFELFSGKVNAFGERDLTALRRLSEMVETAVKLARAAEGVLPQLITGESHASEAVTAGNPDDEILDDEILDDGIQAEALPVHGMVEDENVEVDDPVVVVEAEAAPLTPKVVMAEVVPTATASAPAEEEAAALPIAQTPMHAVPSAAPQTVGQTAPRKPLFWSAASSPVADGETAAETDQSHIPPVLRNLRSCEACGFPVSPGRALCVECEEKKWRGQLRGQAKARQAAAHPPSPAVISSASTPGAPGVRASANTQSAAATAPALQNASSPAVATVRTTLPKVGLRESKAMPKAVAAASLEARSDDFVLSAGLQTSQSWLGTNKYIVGVLLLVAAGAAAFILLH